MKPNKSATPIQHPPLRELESALGHSFRQSALLQLALTHPSTAVNANAGGNNQRLEFLGDAALQLTITRELYQRFSEVDEGPLSQARARLVNEAALASRAQEIGLNAHLRMSVGEHAAGGHLRPSALADAYEAVLGAVFLDGGFDAVDHVILKGFADELAHMAAPKVILNSKGALQERLQARGQPTPQYEIIEVVGPDHDREFTCRALCEGRELGRGIGKSKKAAEGAAAQAALDYLDCEVDDDEAGN